MNALPTVPERRFGRAAHPSFTALPLGTAARNAFELSRRRDILSFTHHREVLGLPSKSNCDDEVVAVSSAAFRTDNSELGKDPGEPLGALVRHPVVLEPVTGNDVVGPNPSIRAGRISPE